MRKGVIFVLLLGAVIGAWFLFGKGCSGDQTRAPEAAISDKNQDVGRPAVTPSGAAAPGSSGASASADAGTGSDASTGPEVVIFSPWGGSQPNQLGRDRPQE